MSTSVAGDYARGPTAHRSAISLSTLDIGTGTGTIPSLSHSPISATSSLNSVGDLTGYTNYFFDFNNNRPLPPRHNPSFSNSAGTTKGLELVMPHVAPAPGKVDSTIGSSKHEHGVTDPWEKKWGKSTPTTTAGSSASTIIPTASTLAVVNSGKGGKGGRLGKLFKMDH
jgi:hypothetical protein